LFELLRQARREKAQELNVPPFVVFGDAALRDMARKKPTNKDAFLRVSGVGQYKCDNFGDCFTEVIRRFVEQSPEAAPSDDEPEEVPMPVRQKTPNSDACHRAAELFAQGMSLAEVSETLERRPGTVGTYLLEYIRRNGISDPTPWVESAVAEQVKNAIAVVGADGLGALFRHLDGEVPYEVIRICVECYRNAGLNEQQGELL
jgi:ATP-dependent DNA helicase RecQ